MYFFCSYASRSDFPAFTIPPVGNDSDNTEQLVTRCRATNFARDHNEFPPSGRTLIVQLSRERGSIVRSFNSFSFNQPYREPVESTLINSD